MNVNVNGCDKQNHDETLFCTTETMDAQCYNVLQPEPVNAKIITLQQREKSQKVKASIYIEQAILQPQSSVPQTSQNINNCTVQQPRLYDMNPPMPQKSRDETTVKSRVVIMIVNKGLFWKSNRFGRGSSLGPLVGPGQGPGRGVRVAKPPTENEF
ncbi:hypothetical protein DPMN_136198 [Dreissena polymorpha]|uniref:Uncharacterized protein n=1 Tax=Dreissena polymorpha TaxID=45954 RepID=A0A9D4G2X4_DREPO|nr:hypothetical protein DPMN_136198 [Dreissena polymorpha]